MPVDNLIGLALRLFSSSHGGIQQTVTPMEGLVLLRQSAPSPLKATLYDPVVCLILQGRKQISFGDQALAFGPGECLLVSHDLPLSSRVTRAPYLALVLKVNVAIIRSLYDDVTEAALDSGHARVAMTHRADDGLVDALGRYLALAHAPADARVLGPLILKELHYRLLTAPFGAMLRSLIRRDSGASAIARAIGHIREDIRSALTVPALARRVGMSTSAFHRHFKTITSTTPLQYQKELRLLEAQRRLKLGATVTSAAFEVGYESPSQFSREYARKFGVPPSHDVARAEETA